MPTINNYPTKLCTISSDQGRSQDFSKGGGGGHTVSNIIVMAFSPRNIVGCFLKKKPYKGGGVTGTPGPPRYALADTKIRQYSMQKVEQFIIYLTN